MQLQNMKEKVSSMLLVNRSLAQVLHIVLTDCGTHHTNLHLRQRRDQNKTHLWRSTTANIHDPVPTS